MHTINMQFINPKEEIIANLEGPIPYEENQEIDIPQKYRGINISSNWQNVLLKENGVYRTTVKIDGIDRGSFEIYVKGKNGVD